MKRIVFLLIASVAAPLLQGCGHSLSRVAPKPEIVDGMAVVSHGWFTMGDDEGDVNQGPQHRVFLSSFRIDIFEMSAERFAEFLNAFGNEGEIYMRESRFSTVVRNAGGEYVPRGDPDYPANNVSWTGADAYCRWKGKRLPTEAEWEKAARGKDLRRYPWGNNPPDSDRARFAMELKGDDMGMFAPVDSLEAGASYFGVYNMAGNVWEWTNDWYRQNYCDFCPEGEEAEKGRGEIAAILSGFEGKSFPATWKKEMEEPERIDPKGPPFGSFKVLRGGSWTDDEPMLATMVRYWRVPGAREPNIGFRCVK